MDKPLQQLSNSSWKPILPSYPNWQDNLVIGELNTAPISTLAVDQFAHAVCNGDEPLNDDPVVLLRHAMIRVYIRAAAARLSARATSKQIASALKALTSLTKMIGHLDKVAPPTQRALQAVFGSPLGNSKGSEESNEFHSSCWQVKLDIVPILLRLWEVIAHENQKPARDGERKKRLRTLVESLADWWEPIGGSVAPHVCSKRRDDGPAVVLDRKGKFVSLARALFCELDNFEDSELIAAITNVHEERLTRKKT